MDSAALLGWYAEKEIREYHAGGDLHQYESLSARKIDGSAIRLNAAGLEHERYEYDGRFEGKPFNTLFLIIGIDHQIVIDMQHKKPKIALSTMFYRIDRQIGISEHNILSLINFLVADITAGLRVLQPVTEDFTFIKGGWPRWIEFESMLPSDNGVWDAIVLSA